ncbi:MAG: D-glycero-beta-D-manno-heptose-7-phosphate kinase [Nitrospirae bacterium]|nr:D-glycero-beta-D-manno-heptose-7-phosphate kinase [Nitrospirota bacterium]
MKDLFKKFSNTGVLVIGDLMVDRYIWGAVRRISPEAPVPVVEVSNENMKLGGAANVAHNISSLGGNAFITGVIGNDNTGNLLAGELKAKGINTEGIITDDTRPTTVKTRVIAHSQQVVRFDRESKSSVSGSLTSRILKYADSCLPHIKGIIISDYSKGVVTRRLVKELVSLARGKIFISADPKIGHFDYYKGVDIITPNINEASFGSGIEIIDEETLLEAGKILLQRLKCRSVLITRGDQGMTLFEKTGEITHIPSIAREVYDVTGAGDTVIATLTLCRAAGLKLKDAAIYANHAAGAVVGEVGTTVVTPNDLINSLKTGDKK